MEQELANALYDEAVDLAFEAFEEPTKEHVQTVLDRLTFNYERGLGNDGATTVH